MTKLRVSSHRLSIESGIWSKPNPTLLCERNCLFCNLLEDEYHFVLECNLFTTLRKLYKPNYYRTRPNMLKMYELINVGNSKVLKNISIFINKAFKLRNSTIYADNRN